MPPGGTFAPTNQTIIRFNFDKASIEHLKFQAASRQPVGMFQWQIYLKY